MGGDIVDIVNELNLIDLLKMSINTFQNTNFSEHDNYKNTILNYKYKDELWRYLLDFMSKENLGTDEIKALSYKFFRENDLSEGLGLKINQNIDLSNNIADLLNEFITNKKNVDLSKESGFNDNTNPFWNESVSKIIATFIRYVLNPEYYEGEDNNIQDERPSTGKGSIIIKSIVNNEEQNITFRIKDIKQANAGRSFSTAPWVKPYYNVNDQSYDDVRGKDRIISDLKNSDKLSFTSNSPYIKLLMPQYQRDVKVEDLNRNFWVIGQTITGISGYLFSSDSPINKMIEGILKEIIELWTNIIYLWLAVAISLQKPKYTDIHKEIIYLSYSDLIQTLVYDNIDSFGMVSTTIHNDIQSALQSKIQNRCSYLRQSYPNSNLIVIPIIRIDNYYKNYYKTECYPGYYTYDRNTDEEDFVLFNKNTIGTAYYIGPDFGYQLGQYMNANLLESPTPDYFSGAAGQLVLLGFELGNLDNYYAMKLSELEQPDENHRTLDNSIAFFRLLRSVPVKFDVYDYGHFSNKAIQLKEFAIDIYDVANKIAIPRDEGDEEKSIIEKRSWKYEDFSGNLGEQVLELKNTLGDWKFSNNSWNKEPGLTLSYDTGDEFSSIIIDSETDTSINASYIKIDNPGGFYMGELMTDKICTILAPDAFEEEPAPPEPLPAVPTDDSAVQEDEDEEFADDLAHINITSIQMTPIGSVPSSKTSETDLIKYHGGRKDLLNSSKSKIKDSNNKILELYAKNKYKSEEESELCLFLPERKCNLSNRYWKIVEDETAETVKNISMWSEETGWPESDMPTKIIQYKGEYNLLPYWYLKDSNTIAEQKSNYTGFIFDLKQRADHKQMLLNNAIIPELSGTNYVYVNQNSKIVPIDIKAKGIPFYNRARDTITFGGLLARYKNGEIDTWTNVDYEFAPSMLPLKTEFNPRNNTILPDPNVDLGQPVVIAAKDDDSNYIRVKDKSVPPGRHNYKGRLIRTYSATNESNVYKIIIYESFGTYVFRDSIPTNDSAYKETFKNYFSSGLLNLFDNKRDNVFCSQNPISIMAWESNTDAEEYEKGHLGHEPKKMSPLIHYVVKTEIIITNLNDEMNTKKKTTILTIMDDQGAPLSEVDAKIIPLEHSDYDTTDRACDWEFIKRIDAAFRNGEEIDLKVQNLSAAVKRTTQLAFENLNPTPGSNNG